MKRLLLIAIALVMAFTLAACNLGKTSTDIGSPAQASSQESTAAPSSNGTSTDKTDLTTVSGFLSAYGLTEEDVKCANCTRLDKTMYNSQTKVIKEVGAYASKAMTNAEIEEWLTKIINKLNSLSADGKIANSHADADGAPLTVEFIMGQSMLMGGGSYDYNGKTVSVVIAVFPNALDNDDPNEAMPACTLMLELL